MNDTDLIVPVRVNALVANEVVRKSRRFQRWEPLFDTMLDQKVSCEPLPFQNTHTLDEWFEGVHVQWELPEALTDGFHDDATGAMRYPLVPNRWLVVRYAETRARPEDPWQPQQPAGWVVQSDYLSSDHQDPADPPWTEPEHGWGTSTFLNPRSPSGNPSVTEIGRFHELTAAGGPWREPARRDPFLTAVGAGLPSFAAFEPYHRDVFSFRDTLSGLRDPQGRMPGQARLSHFVLGWYSEAGIDILRKATEIPDLLPPDPTMQDILTALGWTTLSESVPESLERTLYCGSALGIVWDHKGPAPAPDLPHHTQVKVAVGHSTDEAYAALVDNQTRSPRTARLMQSLYQGSLDTFDTADGDRLLDEATHRSWFSGQDGGHTWHIVRRPAQDSNPPPTPPTPAWLADLNAAQAAYDRAVPELTHTQWRLWTLHWLLDLTRLEDPPPHPGFDTDQAQREHDDLTAKARAQIVEVDQLRDRIPWGDDAEQLQVAIDAYAERRGLDPALELKRLPQESFHTAADPVLLLQGTRSTRPLGRDSEKPLPCRFTSERVTRALIDGQENDAPTTPPIPPAGLADLPAAAKSLLSEFALLDRASRTGTAPGRTALHDITEAPKTYVKQGELAEYATPWRQPWLPMFLQWQLYHCPTPYHTLEGGGTGTYHWHFNGTTYKWLATGAPTTDNPDEATEGHRMALFARRAYLAPTTSYVTDKQLARYIRTYPKAPTRALRALRTSLTGLDDLLSQRLDGFNDWLLQHDGGAQLTAPPEIADLIGPDNHVPDPASDRLSERFQPVRAGQFFFHQLVMIDRFGQTLSKVWVAPEHDGPYQFKPVPVGSTTPDHPLYSDPPPDGPERYFALPPRILQPARVRLQTADATDMSTPPAEPNPLVGWLLVNYLDRTLLVHAPDGAALGELRVIRDGDNQPVTAWAPLPHAVHAHPTDPGFHTDHPHLAQLLTDLLDQPHSAFEALMATINRTLDTITNPVAHDDQVPVQLIGRPVALVRAHLGIDLDGPPRTDSTWRHAIAPPAEDYPDYTWPVRLGDHQRLSDGLIGYYSSATGPDQPTSYRHFHAVAPAGSGDYVKPIGNGSGLALPARPADRHSTHHLTLLTEPHNPVHAITDILPSTALELDADLVHKALSGIQASFRLHPLLAATRTSTDRTASSSLGATEPHIERNAVDQDLGTYYVSKERARAGNWFTIDLGTRVPIASIDIYLGDPKGDHTAPAADLQISDDASSWSTLHRYARTTEIHHTAAAGTAARYVRLHLADGQDDRLAIRSFDITTPDSHGIVLPQPSARYGTWHWTQPRHAATPTPWHDHSTIPADINPHSDDPVPTARAGYLRLLPADAPQPRTHPLLGSAPTGQPQTNGHPHAD
ncbi:discoidin domain-containing protein [Streptomyces sp. NPDC004296]|uniref:discoidin domain-containing protein n=1 Tax=Streptomyces sp. NPDC004296 TaxID=3364697 RepID=UPI0036A1D6E1